MTVRLDLRHLPPPQPMEHILDALPSLPPGTCLEALTPFRPLPLLPILEDMGYAWRLEQTPDGQELLRVCRREDAATALASAVSS